MSSENERREAAGTRQGREGRRAARAQAGRAIAPVPGNNI